MLDSPWQRDPINRLVENPVHAKRLVTRTHQRSKVAGENHDLSGKERPAKLPHQRKPIQARHQMIGNQDIKQFRIGRQPQQRLMTVLGKLHRLCRTRKKPAKSLSNIAIILGTENTRTRSPGGDSGNNVHVLGETNFIPTIESPFAEINSPIKKLYSGFQFYFDPARPFGSSGKDFSPWKKSDLPALYGAGSRKTRRRRKRRADGSIGTVSRAVMV